MSLTPVTTIFAYTITNAEANVVQRYDKSLRFLNENLRKTKIPFLVQLAINSDTSNWAIFITLSAADATPDVIEVFSEIIHDHVYGCMLALANGA